MAWNENNMLFKDSMFDVDENVDKSESLGEDPIVSNELDEDEVKHDPFEFLNDDKIMFSRLLYDPTVLQVQGFDNGDANPNMPLFEGYVQVSNEPPEVVHVLTIQSQHTPNQWVIWKCCPPSSLNTPLILIIILEWDAQ
jgi:hypothetical protein